MATFAAFAGVPLSAGREWGHSARVLEICGTIIGDGAASALLRASTSFRHAIGYSLALLAP